jgi:hypothetical protein
MTLMPPVFGTTEASAIAGYAQDMPALSEVENTPLAGRSFVKSLVM